MKLSASSRAVRSIAVIALVSLVLGGCDKCGNRIKLNTPALQHACSYEPATAQ